MENYSSFFFHQNTINSSFHMWYTAGQALKYELSSEIDMLKFLDMFRSVEPILVYRIYWNLSKGVDKFSVERKFDMPTSNMSD